MTWTLVNWLLKRPSDCCRFNIDTDNKPDRTIQVDRFAPACLCEKTAMSWPSPEIVKKAGLFKTLNYFINPPEQINDLETLDRFLFIPIQVNKKGILKEQNVFDHVFNKGCSILRQRASPKIAAEFVKNTLNEKPAWSWVGVYSGPCQRVREIVDEKTSSRLVCIYDTGDPVTMYHGELCGVNSIAEDSWSDIREELFDAFGGKTYTTVRNYQSGKVFDLLSPEHKARVK